MPPLHAHALAREEGAEGGEHDAHDVLHHVFGDPCQRRAEDDPDDQDDERREEGAEDRPVEAGSAQRDHDEDDLQALEEDAVERGDRPHRVDPVLDQATMLEEVAPLRFEDGSLVVQRLEPARAKHGLVEPLEPEEQQEDADQGAGDRDRDDRRQRDSEDEDQADQRNGSEDQAQEGALPAFEKTDRQHDREGLDPFHPCGQEGDRTDQGQVHLVFHSTRRKGRLNLTISTNALQRSRSSSVLDVRRAGPPP